MLLPFGATLFFARASSSTNSLADTLTNGAAKVATPSSFRALQKGFGASAMGARVRPFLPTVQKRGHKAMESISAFLDKLTEYATNNITAFEGLVQITFNEREDLRLRYHQLSEADRATAREALKANGLDVASWG
jgi:hypothetical protein